MYAAAATRGGVVNTRLHLMDEWTYELKLYFNSFFYFIIVLLLNMRQISN